MGTIWFWMVAAILAAYVILDGFDLGVGIVLPFVAKTEMEKQHLLRAIGPVWDGNEVWLIAAGGTLFFAFPLVYASAFSGFYLPLMMVLWLLMLRGLAIELRSRAADPLWSSFWDSVLFGASALLAIFFGAALANVIRGVPIGPDHYFFLPLWTTWRTGSSPGILDWYTLIGAVVALVALAMHGALYLALKTRGDLGARCRRLAARLWFAVVGLTILAIPATVIARPGSLHNYMRSPAAFLAPIVVIVSLALILIVDRKGLGLAAFLSSCAYLAAMLAGAAAGLYPTLLPSTNPSGASLTIRNSIAGPHGLHVGLAWWVFGIGLASLYFGVIYWLFRGKVDEYEHMYHH